MQPDKSADTNSVMTLEEARSLAQNLTAAFEPYKAGYPVGEPIDIKLARFILSLPHPEPRKDVEAVGSVDKEVELRFCTWFANRYGTREISCMEPFRYNELRETFMEATRQASESIQSARKDIEREVAEQCIAIIRGNYQYEHVKFALDCAVEDIESEFLKDRGGA